MNNATGLVNVHTNDISEYSLKDAPLEKEGEGIRNGKVDWDTPNLKVTRLRMVSDRGFPYWDISYCYGVLDGKHVRVRLPFSQIPKPFAPEAKAWGFGKGFIINEAKRAGVFAKGLGILDCFSQTQA